MRSIIILNGKTFIAEVFEYDHHGWPISWSVYNEAGEDFSDSLDWQQQEKVERQLTYTTEDARAERAYEDWKSAR